MYALRAFTAAAFVVVLVYTLIVGINHGWNLAPVFFGNLTAMNWSGQFNLDFMTYLALSALWTAWRHEFSVGGLVLAVLVLSFGTLFFSAYLFFHAIPQANKAGGSAKTLLLGSARAARA